MRWWLGYVKEKVEYVTSKVEIFKPPHVKIMMIEKNCILYILLLTKLQGQMIKIVYTIQTQPKLIKKNINSQYERTKKHTNN